MRYYMNNLISVSLLAVAAFSTSCGKSSSPDKSGGAPAPSNVAAKAAESADAMENRVDFQNTVDQAYGVLETNLQSLEANLASEQVADVKAAMENRLASLRQSMKDGKQRIDELKDASEDAWKEKREAVITSLQAAEQKINLEIQRQDYEKQALEKLNKLDAKIQSAQQGLAGMAADVKVKAEGEAKELEAAAQKLKPQYNELRLVTEDKWETLKTGLDESFSTLAQTFKDIF